MPEDDTNRLWLSIGITVFISLIVTAWGIYAIEQYGLAMFLLTPFFVGFSMTVLYGLKKGVTGKSAFLNNLMALAILFALLMLFAVEGAICLVMAAPITLLLSWFGCLLGNAVVNKTPDSAPTSLLIFLIAIPSTALVERNMSPDLTAVVTSIEIQASPETVWKNVVEFPELEEPSELIFKTGIAYPINAKIDGSGVGAVRHCNFTTGSFVEPITVWDEPNLLKFDVEEQPAPMKELSFWDIDAPHLHDYFVSKEGQFKLIQLPNGNTLLEGTTWYYHNIRPAFYWQLWSNHIIHKIHARVLVHIKKNAEEEAIRSYENQTIK